MLTTQGKIYSSTCVYKRGKMSNQWPNSIHLGIRIWKIEKKNQSQETKGNNKDNRGVRLNIIEK